MDMNRPDRRGLVEPLAVIALAAAAFATLAESVNDGHGLASIDPTVTGDVVEHRTSALTATAQLLSFVGSEVVLAVLALGLVVVLLERCGPRPAALAAVAMASSVGLTVGVKAVFERARPGTSDRLGAFDSSYSFPSGHSLNSAVFLGVACLLLVRLLPHRGARIGAYCGAMALAIGIGMSRVYLGYHWTTDVLASWTIAAMLLTVVHLTQQKLTTPARQSGSVQVVGGTVD